jgi:hypothetical protein
MSGQNQHFVTFPFALEHSEGGLTSVFLTEGKSRPDPVTFLSVDEREFNFGAAKVVPVDPSTVNMGDVFTRWFGYKWNILFDRAFTSLPPEILREMYVAEISAHEIGTLDHLIEYSEKLGPGKEVDIGFSRRYSGPLSKLIAAWQGRGDEVGKLVINYTDAFWYPDLIKEFGPELKKVDAFSSCHIHTSVSPTLSLSQTGREILEAAASVDAVYVHAEEYVDRLGTQLDRLNLKMPEIRRFDLGADAIWIKDNVNKYDRNNFDSAPDYAKLNESQRALVEEIFRTQESVPHRFICIDRLEPTKGVHT